MRFDFLRDCAAFDGLPEALNETQYLVPRLSYDELLEAITKPAAAWTERPRSRVTPRLANRLINDLGQEVDQLPLLQHFLRRLWTLEAEHSQSADAPLMLDADDADTLLQLDVEPGLSRLGQVLSDHADEALGELKGSLPRVACRAFRVLTERGSGARDIRRPLALATVAAIVDQKPETVQAAMQPFIDRDFIRLDSDGELNIAHETLIWHWQQLQQWVHDEANSLVIYRRLRESARLYREKRGSLLQYPELGEVLFWRDSERPTPAWAALYLDPEKKRPGDPEHNLKVAAKELGEAMSFLKKSRLRWDLRKAFVRAVPIAAVLLTLVAVLDIQSILRQTRKAQERAEAAVAEMEDARTAAKDAQIAAVRAEDLMREARDAETLARTTLSETQQQIVAANQELERVRARSLQEIEKAATERKRAEKATEDAQKARDTANRAERKANDAERKNREVEDSLRQRFDQQLRSASAFMRGGDPYQARAILEQIAADREIVTPSRRRVLQAMSGLVELISKVPLSSFDAGQGAERLTVAPDEPLMAIAGSTPNAATSSGKLQVLKPSSWGPSPELHLPAVVRGLAFETKGVLWLSDAEGVIHRYDPASDQHPRAVFRVGGTSFAIALAPEKAFGPLHDGPFLANAGTVVRLVDLESGKVLRELKRKKLWSQLLLGLRGKKFLDVAFQKVPSKGHGPLVAAAAENHLMTWELESRLRVDDKDHYGDLHTAVAFHPDKPHLAAVGPNREAVLVLDPTTGLAVSQRRIVFQHPRPVTDVVFLDDGRRLATAAEDGRVRIWTWNETAGEGQLLRVLEPRGGGAALRQLEVDDGGFIHSLDANGTLQRYYSGDEPTIIEPREPLGTVAQVVLSPDLKRVAVTEVSVATPSKSSKDGAATYGASVRLFDRTSRGQWDLAFGERSAAAGAFHPRIFFSGDELYVATSTKAVALAVDWTVSHLIPANTVNARKDQRAEKVLQNGTILSATVDGAGSVHIWRQEKPDQSPSRVLVEKVPGAITELHFSDDGSRLLMQLGGRGGTETELRILSLGPSGGSITLPEQRLISDQISAISPHGRRVVLAAPLSLDTTCQGACLSVLTLEAEALKVADQTTLKIEHPVSPVASSVAGTPPDLLLDVDFGPDDNLLAMLSRDGYLRLWDLDGGSELFALEVPVAAVPGQSGAIDFACTRLTVDPVSVDCAIAVVLPPDRLVVYDLGSFEIDG